MNDFRTRRTLPSICLSVLAFLQNALLGGVLYGWASIDRTLLTTEPDHGGAGLSPNESTRIFSIASSVSMIATLVLGAILDVFGPRWCSIASHLCIASGFVLFSQGNYLLGASLIAFGGPGIQISVVHVSNLFIHTKYLVLASLTGSMSLSFLVFTVFDALSTAFGFSLQHLFEVYTGVIFVSLIASIMVWPNNSFPAPSRKQSTEIFSRQIRKIDRTPEDDYVEATTAHAHLVDQPLGAYLRAEDDRTKDELKARMSYCASKMALIGKQRDEINWTQVSLKDRPFWMQLCSGSYFRSTLFLCTTCFLANFAVASFSTEIDEAFNYITSDQHKLARILTIFMSCGVLASFVAGFVMDRIGVELCGVATIVLGMSHVLMMCELGGARSWLIVSFTFYGLFRSFLFPVFIALLTHHLGFKYFGLLNGLAFALSGITQLSMPALVSLVQGDCQQWQGTETSTLCTNEKWKYLHYVETGIMAALLLIGPYWEHKSAAKKRQETQHALLAWTGESSVHSSLFVNPESAAFSESFYGTADKELDALLQGVD